MNTLDLKISENVYPRLIANTMWFKLGSKVLTPKISPWLIMR